MSEINDEIEIIQVIKRPAVSKSVSENTIEVPVAVTEIITIDDDSDTELDEEQPIRSRKRRRAPEENVRLINFHQIRGLKKKNCAMILRLGTDYYLKLYINQKYRTGPRALYSQDICADKIYFRSLLATNLCVELDDVRHTLPITSTRAHNVNKKLFIQPTQGKKIRARHDGSVWIGYAEAQINSYLVSADEKLTLQIDANTFEWEDGEWKRCAVRRT
jgi:hypothetical protein